MARLIDARGPTVESVPVRNGPTVRWRKAVGPVVATWRAKIAAMAANSLAPVLQDGRWLHVQASAMPAIPIHAARV
jgi:hypothetical protein